LAALTGCRDGPELAEVTGKVTYNDQPVVGAVIDFRPVGEGKQSIGFTDEQGEYEMQYTLRRSGALLGRHKVSVRIYPPEGVKPIPVPKQYSSSDGVEVEVESGSNRFDIDLSS
jgi:hypothetical protein